jgi:TfoX/Sxy family transcriptional regulator of competence genes
MAYDEGLAARIREVVAGLSTGGPVEEQKMFGGLAFLLGGHMAVAASGEGGLLVRCAHEQTAALVSEPGASPMLMRGKAMAGWLRVTDEAVVDEEALERWVERSLAYAGSLPPR